VHVTIEEIVFVSPREAAFVYTLHSSGRDLAGELGRARTSYRTRRRDRPEHGRAVGGPQRIGHRSELTT
jgi:hypothetical protein